MPYNLRVLAERRLSFKILGHKLRARLPFAYDLLLQVRYAFFPKRCRDEALPDISYSDGSWITRKTTADLLQIEAYLQTVPQPFSVLQVGVGNSSLYRAIKDRASRFTGITVVEDEIRFAKESFGSGHDVRLMNKYSTELETLPGPYDYIVDNDISSYACCHTHFGVMLDAYRKLLSPTGAVLVGHRGLRYFDSGFGLTEPMMRKLASQHGLTFETGDVCYFLKRA